MLLISTIDELKEYIQTNRISLYGAGSVGKSLIEWIEDNRLSNMIENIYDKNKIGKLYGYYIKKYEDYDMEFPLIISTKYKLAKEIAFELDLYEQAVLLSDTVCDELMLYMDKKYLAKLSKKITEDIKNIIYWENDWERKFLLNNGWDVLNTNIYKQYTNLIRNLDDESIDYVNKIIGRIRLIINSCYKKINLFSTEEQNELKRIKYDFPIEILKFDENIYAYKHYILPINHFESSVFLYKHEISILNNREKLNGTTFIDAGGFIGDSILVLEELKPKKIISFEALEYHCELIQQTIKLNNLENVVVECKALGEEPGKLTMQVAGSGTNAVGRKGIEYSDEISVPVVTLDDYCNENEIECVGLIKADIEGMESFMLKGGRKIIERDLPTLLISIYHNPHDFFEIKPMIESWKLGYKMTVRKPVTGGVVGETLLICEAE